jgi:hypothetical protein
MSRAILTLANDKVRERAIQLVREAPAGYRVDIHEPVRTLDQNALAWPLYTAIAEQVEWFGQTLTPEDFRDILTAGFRKARVVPGIDPGTVVALGLRTSKMSKAEFSEFIEYIYWFGATRGVVFHSDEAAA